MARPLHGMVSWAETGRLWATSTQKSQDKGCNTGAWDPYRCGLQNRRQVAQVLQRLRDTSVCPNQKWPVPNQPFRVTSPSEGPGSEKTLENQKGRNSVQKVKPQRRIWIPLCRLESRENSRCRVLGKGGLDVRPSAALSQREGNQHLPREGLRRKPLETNISCPFQGLSLMGSFP